MFNIIAPFRAACTHSEQALHHHSMHVITCPCCTAQPQMSCANSYCSSTSATSARLQKQTVSSPVTADRLPQSCKAGLPQQRSDHQSCCHAVPPTPSPALLTRPVHHLRSSSTAFDMLDSRCKPAACELATGSRLVSFLQPWHSAGQAYSLHRATDARYTHAVASTRAAPREARRAARQPCTPC